MDVRDPVLHSHFHALTVIPGAGVPLTSPQLYSAGHTDDLRQALIYISQKYPKAQLYGVGFSLGASVLVNYLGQEGTNSRLRAGCSLGAVWSRVLIFPPHLLI